MTAHTPDEAAVSAARQEVARLHAELVRYGLVVWTAGNVSARVAASDLFVIKPSGISYEDLRPDAMIVCDLDGQVVARNSASEPPPLATLAPMPTSTGTC